MRTFFQELKRRRVYRVAIGYGIAASATVQLVGTVLPMFHARDWVQQLVVVLVALGFPIALAFGWVYDLRAGGLRRTTSPGAQTAADYRRLWVLAATGLLIAGAALAGYWLWHPWTNFEVTEPPGLPSVALPPPADVPENSIAVLPFTNLSQDKANAQLADGVCDEIITDLAKVAALKVISRTSTVPFGSGRPRNLREIGKDLGTAHVLEGTVQREGNRVRVSAQLIDARTDTHLWADSYDRDLSSLFALESELAETIVTQLKARFSAEEKALIEEKPTSDTIAHDLYLRANALIATSAFNVQGTENLFEAAELLQKAVARDPEYFLAYCQLASVHDQIYLVGSDHTPARLSLAEAAVKAAQRLRPDAGETHLVLAEHLYCGFLDYDRAREELRIAHRSLPNEPLIFELAGFIDRRQGRWDDSIRNLQRALELDPRNVYTLQQLAGGYQFVRRYADAASVLQRALEIVPNDSSLRVARAATELYWRADPHPLHTVIDTILKEDPRAGAGLADDWLDLALCERDPVGAARALAAMRSDGISNQGVVFSAAWCEALVAQMQGDAALERAALERARSGVEQSLRDDQDSGQLLCMLGMIDAGLGRKDEAIREGRRAVELLPLDKDSINGALAIEYLAVTYAWTGEKDQAIEQLKRAASIPSDVSYGQLRLHPFWDSLRGDPRFEEIVASLARGEGCGNSLEFLAGPVAAFII